MSQISISRLCMKQNILSKLNTFQKSQIFLHCCQMYKRQYTSCYKWSGNIVINYCDNIFVKRSIPKCTLLTWGLTHRYEIAIYNSCWFNSFHKQSILVDICVWWQYSTHNFIRDHFLFPKSIVYTKKSWQTVPIAKLIHSLTILMWDF